MTANPNTLKLCRLCQTNTGTISVDENPDIIYNVLVITNVKVISNLLFKKLACKSC